MGRASWLLCALLAAGCQKVFDVRQVGEGEAGVAGEAGMGSGIVPGQAYHQQAMLGMHTVLVPFQTPPAAHDLIVVFIAAWHNVPSLVRDTAGNSYVMAPATAMSSGGSNLYLYYAYDAMTMPTFSVTVDSTPASGNDLGKDELTVVAQSYSGAMRTDPRDTINTVAGDGSPGPMVSEDCQHITVSSAELMVAGLTRDFNGSTTVRSTGWKLESSVDLDHTQYMVLATADRVSAGPEASDPVFATQTATGGYTWACLTASFR